MSRLYPERLNRDFKSTDENNKIQEAYMRVLNPPLDEDAAQKAYATLKAIIGALEKKMKDKKKAYNEGGVYKMAVDVKKHFDKEKWFSKGQAQWIYKTSTAMFKV